MKAWYPHPLRGSEFRGIHPNSAPQDKHARNVAKVLDMFWPAGAETSEICRAVPFCRKATNSNTARSRFVSRGKCNEKWFWVRSTQLGAALVAVAVAALCFFVAAIALQYAGLEADFARLLAAIYGILPRGAVGIETLLNASF